MALVPRHAHIFARSAKAKTTLRPWLQLARTSIACPWANFGVTVPGCWGGRPKTILSTYSWALYAYQFWYYQYAHFYLLGLLNTSPATNAVIVCACVWMFHAIPCATHRHSSPLEIQHFALGFCWRTHRWQFSDRSNQHAEIVQASTEQKFAVLFSMLLL